MTSDNDSTLLTAETREKLNQVRRQLLHLHKAILDAERASYERTHGRIESPHAVLQLVMHDPWFGWFRPLSEILVRIDELLEAGRGTSSIPGLSAPEEPATEAAAQALLRELRSLLVPAEQGEEFSTKYHAVLQAAPEIILAHAQMSQLLG